VAILLLFKTKLLLCTR